MTINDQTTELLAIIAIVVGLSAAYAKIFGRYQFQISEWVIDAFTIKSRFKGLVNLAVGISLTLAFSLLGALQTGEWGIIAVGGLAGVMASVEASKEYQQNKEQNSQKPINSDIIRG